LGIVLDELPASSTILLPLAPTQFLVLKKAWVHWVMTVALEELQVLSGNPG
jgi:hypothetical protein